MLTTCSKTKKAYSSKTATESGRFAQIFFSATRDEPKASQSQTKGQAKGKPKASQGKPKGRPKASQKASQRQKQAKVKGKTISTNIEDALHSQLCRNDTQKYLVFVKVAWLISAIKLHLNYPMVAAHFSK